MEEEQHTFYERRNKGGAKMYVGEQIKETSIKEEDLQKLIDEVDKRNMKIMLGEKQ